MMPFYVPVKIAPEEPVAPQLHCVLKEQNAIRVVVILFLSIECKREVRLVSTSRQCRTPAAEDRRNNTLYSYLLGFLSIGGHPRGCSRLPVYSHDRRMYVVLDVLVVEFQVKYAIVHAQLRVVDSLSDPHHIVYHFLCCHVCMRGTRQSSHDAGLGLCPRCRTNAYGGLPPY